MSAATDSEAGPSSTTSRVEARGGRSHPEQLRIDLRGRDTAWLPWDAPGATVTVALLGELLGESSASASDACGFADGAGPAL
ncbi:hypothetical protein [Streptomyces sp. MZ04]|uniref:hypothetical protein n=1 Tax=Streptomyces sp. MZ04 TaxID=2559236 RepID=UPI001432BF3F|nr:hypothetical protein [Streptomyces sp. MZ04]